jgi:GAF domain-containing protein
MAEDKQPHRSRFHKAKDDAKFAKQATTTPQTASAAYKLAFQDNDFLLREDLRPVRFQLELLKPELLLDEAKIESMLVIYGSARIPEPAAADALEAAATDDVQRTIARRLKEKSKYYEEARALARLASQVPPGRKWLPPLRRLFGRRSVDHGSGESRR